jgi:hypothetical protein
MTNYQKNTRPELLQIIRKYNKNNPITYLRIRNYNHDTKNILVETCKAIDGGNDAIKAFLHGGKDAIKNDKKERPPLTLTPLTLTILTSLGLKD